MATQTVRAPALPRTQEASTARVGNPRRRGIVIRQILLQIFLLFMLVIVMFPVLWIVSMAVDPRGVARPTELNLIPANANLDAFRRILTDPFSNVLPLYFGDMLMNSLFVALGTSLFSVVVGSSAAYSFSRFRFAGRQGGMLAFIILLMLPATGTLIPLYIMFSSVQINSTLAALPPALFSGFLVAGVIYLVYRMVNSYGKKEYDRRFNPSPRALSIAVAILALIAITATFFVIIDRDAGYTAAIKVPSAGLDSEYRAAQDDYNQRTTSVARREQTAEREAQSAALIPEQLAELTTLQAELAALNDTEAIRARVTELVEARTALDLRDDVILFALEAVQPAIDGGVDPFRLALTEAVTAAYAEAAEIEEDATNARVSADEAIAGLGEADLTLIAARAQYDADLVRFGDARSQIYAGVIPFILLAWVAAMVGAAVVWGIVRAVSGSIEPRTLISIMAGVVMLVLGMALSYIALQSRMEGARGSTETLRTTLVGLSLAFASGGLPFTIWNLKGYFDTIPKDLEEAALIDGANRVETFLRIMIPLALPAFAIVLLFSFMSGWTEFILSWVFMTGRTENYTLAMALATLANGANQAPPDMQKFAAMAILISLPILVLFFLAQRWIVGGLTIGGSKG